MDLDAFVAEHAASWRRLERLAAKRRRMSAAETDELVTLYQRTATHLSLVRSRSPDPALIARLSRLVLAARGALTGTPVRFWPAISRFFTETFPVAVYRATPWWAGTGTVFVVVGAWLILHYASHPADVLQFVSQEQVDALVDREFVDYYRQAPAQNFAFAVWTNNALVSALCLASGILLLPVFFLLFLNALNLGLVGGVMVGHGRSGTFFGMLLVHGMLELTCIFVAAGVGLRIGWSWIAPGPTRTRGQALAEAGRSGMVVALGLAAVLLVSGLVEAYVTPFLPIPVGLVIGGGIWLGFIAYVMVLGRSAAQAGLTGDLAEEEREASVPTA